MILIHKLRLVGRVKSRGIEIREGWRSEMIEDILILLHGIWFGEKWMDEKLFYLIENKSEMI